MFFQKKNALPGGITHIICGLGNPGVDYENTRHNCGFMALDVLCENHNFPLPKKIKFKSLTSLVTLDGVKVLLMKPTTYMDLSGDAVTEAAGFYKIPPQRVVVVYDDVALPLGSIRVRQKGSDGGHNGIKSIITRLNSDEFLRVKIGIQPAGRGTGGEGLANFVTTPFRKDEGEAVLAALAIAADAAEMMVKGEVVAAMNRYNVRKG